MEDLSIVENWKQDALNQLNLPEDLVDFVIDELKDYK